VSSSPLWGSCSGPFPFFRQDRRWLFERGFPSRIELERRSAYVGSVTRVLFTFALILGFLSGPSATMAASKVCDQQQAMAGMSMSGPAAGAAQPSKAPEQPCCPKPGQKSGMSCAQVCAAMAGVGMTAPPEQVAFVPFTTADSAPFATVATMRSHEPTGLRRPPRSIA